MAERRLHGLQRVLGVNALFSTAYGNVGSSIYYALGLVASFALGLTPLVFIITGFIFFLVASTYAEATAMYPEAGGSSSFARHAFNEFWSFFAAWAQMLNYTITIAISAFFVPHYLGGLFWEPLRSSPGDIIFGMGVVVVLSLVNIVGVKESAGVNVTLALHDFATQLLLVLVGMFLVFSPQTLIDNVSFGIAPTRTSSSCVAKSSTASVTLTPADSLTPTTLTIDSSTTTAMPKAMSPGEWRSAGQNSPPR